MRAMLLALAAVVLAGCYGVPTPTRAVMPDQQPEDAAGHWAAVLETHVDEMGRIDFVGLAAAPAALERYVAYVAAVSPENRPDLFATRDHAMAYYINVYNALAMYNVIRQDFPYSLGGPELLRFFVHPHFQVGGRSINLLALEREVIVGGFADPRLHFALNCMVRDCPILPQQPFAAADLDAVLDRETRRFATDERTVRVDPATRTVTLNEIFGFYEDEFVADAGSLIAYLNRYRTDPIPADYAVVFRPYDWRVNYQPGTEP